MRKLQKLSAVPRVGEIGRLEAEKPTEPDIPTTPRGPDLLETMPEKVEQWARLIGRDRARAIQRLVEDGVVGTLPELCAYDWLNGRYLFEFQSSLMGGRLIRGGAVADFVIVDLASGGLVVWRIQGDYWHTKDDRERQDEEQKGRLLGTWYMGMPIVTVVDIWESDIYERFPEVFRRAEAGVEL